MAAALASALLGACAPEATPNDDVDVSQATSGRGGGLASGGAASATTGEGGAGAATAASTAASSTSASTGGQPGCSHPPANDPSADDTGLEPGPIVKFTVKVYYIKRPPDDAVVDPVEQGGKWLSLVGDKIVFDSTQKNSDNKPCQWESEPVYDVWDPSCAFERLPTQNPFLLQMHALAPGELFVSATIDGVLSNELVLEALP